MKDIEESTARTRLTGQNKLQLPGSSKLQLTLLSWCDTAEVDTAFIDPRLPWQNGFIEFFNAHFRRDQLSGEIMHTMAEVKYLAEEWKAIYNHERPHGSLDGMTPNRY